MHRLCRMYLVAKMYRIAWLIIYDWQRELWIKRIFLDYQWSAWIVSTMFLTCACIVFFFVQTSNDACITCKECVYCYNCERCGICEDCIDCEYCYNCNDCGKCVRCNDCIRCVRCKDCKDCTDCHDMTN